MVAPSKLDTETLEHIDRFLNETVEQESWLYENGPYVALGFRQDQISVVSPFSSAYKINLTGRESPSEELKFWSKVTDNLMRRSIVLQDSLRFKLTYFAFPNEAPITPGVLLASMGYKSNCEDWEKSMHNVDSAGDFLLRVGMDLGQMPAWIKTNYPFCCSREISSDTKLPILKSGWNNEGLAQIIKKISDEKGSAEGE